MANSLVVRKGTDLAKRIRALRAAQYVRMPKVIPYALRHSSIVRGLRKGLPIKQVAKLAQHLSQNDRAALRKIHCDRVGRPRKGGSRVPGAAERWKRGTNGETRVGALPEPVSK
jgi:hypothetical protein